MNVSRHIVFCSQVFPDHPAVVFGEQTLTYGEVERLSAHAAATLRDAGVAEGDRVGVLVPNVPAFVVWYFAALRIGAVAVSISTRLAAEEVAFILADCDAQTLVTTEPLQDLLGQQAPSCLRRQVTASEDGLRCDGQALDQGEAIAPGEIVELAPDRPAVILYTSGTTGFPKGATLSHQNILATVHAFNHLCRMGPDDRLLLAVPLFHCYGQNALLNSGFQVGATLVLQRRFDLNESKQLIQQHAVTKLFGVPTTFQLLLEYCTPDELSSVGYCFSAAATLPPQVAERWRERFGMPIYEGYGLTETAPFASYNHRVHFVPGSIGTPVDLVEMKVVDPETGETCASGEPGEIVIRGPNVMLGYWNRPEETAAAVRDGWFHSGDIGRCDERGYFYILDRLKDMISIGGMKVFPAEVERVLLDHEDVAEAAVIGLPDDVMGERVAAILVPRPGSSPTRESIEAHCAEHLGSFKSPKRIELVEELPRNPAGKVLKTRLREQWSQAPAESPSERQVPVVAEDDTKAAAKAPSSRGNGAADSAPSDANAASPLGERLRATHPASRRRTVVQLLQDAVAELADLERRPEPDTMLLDAGLDSLMIVELRDRLQQQVGSGIELSATLVFDHPRLSDLAGYLVESLTTGDNGAESEASSEGPGSDLPPQRLGDEHLAEIQEMSEQDALRELMRELDE